MKKPKPRKRMIMVRLSEAEYKAWAKAARLRGVAPATWARDVGNEAAVPCEGALCQCFDCMRPRGHGSV